MIAEHEPAEEIAGIPLNSLQSQGAGPSPGYRQPPPPAEV